MRKKAIADWFYVNIIFNKKNITQVTSNVFWRINTTIENKNDMTTEEFLGWSYWEMKKKTISRQKKANEGQEKRKLIYKKYWLDR